MKISTSIATLLLLFNERSILRGCNLFIKSIDNPVILLPEVKGQRKKKLEKSLNSFKNYLVTLNQNVIFIENKSDYIYSEHNNLLVIDGFDMISLVNLLQHNENIHIIIPDFLYFNYQPWIRYKLLQYKSEAQLNPIRELLDSNFTSNKKEFTKNKSEVIKSIKLDIQSYREKYILEHEIEEIVESLPEIEDFVLRNDEELENSSNTKENTKEIELEIHTTDDKIFRLNSNTQVLLQRNSIISCRSLNLVPGDYFITKNEINSVIVRDTVINNLSRIPNSVKYYQTMLGEIPRVYQILKEHGLIYQNEKYFINRYVKKQNEFEDLMFAIPRKKDYWKIICEFLGISSAEMNQAWISYFGRSDINEIKSIYLDIFNLCINERFLGEMENPEMIRRVSNLFENNKELFFKDEKEVNMVEIAKSTIHAIINELSFHQVKEIKTY